MKWDEEVDVVCTGAGVAGLATAILAVDVGAEVCLAGSSGRQPGTESLDRRAPHLWCGVDILDPETNEYFAALSSDLAPLAPTMSDLAVPVRVVHQPVPADRRATLAPFFGERLRDWTARCLVSPYGYLYTRVSHWESTRLHTSDGEAIETAEIGSLVPDPDNVGGSVLDWLTAQARDRGIAGRRGASLQRLVFEEGDVVGAVLDTAEGPWAVRTRHGVAVASGPAAVTAAVAGQPPQGEAVRVCLVGQTASRFGRVELLTSGPLVGSAPATCREANRQLHACLRDTQLHSHPWRCGKRHGNPPVGQ